MKRQCGTCGGSGAVRKPKKRKRGDGKIVTEWVIDTCGTCRGSGKL